MLVSLVHIASKPMSLQQQAQATQIHCQTSRDPTWVVANADFGIEMPREQPEAWVGQKCKVFWPDDAEWYDAVVRAYDRSNGKHNVWYSYDQQVSFTLLPLIHVHCSCHVALKLASEDGGYSHPNPIVMILFDSQLPKSINLCTSHKHASCEAKAHNCFHTCASKLIAGMRCCLYCRVNGLTWEQK